MNDQTLLALATSTLQQRYGEATPYLKNVLRVAVDDVTAGRSQLTGKQRQELRYLYTDYEWMLAQKIAVLNGTEPAEGGVAARFQAAKTTIAKAWLASPNLATRYVKEQRGHSQVNVHLQLRLDYGIHGLTDILDFVVPTQAAKQIETQKLDLLTWAKRHLNAAPDEANA